MGFHVISTRALLKMEDAISSANLFQIQTFCVVVPHMDTFWHQTINLVTRLTHVNHKMVVAIKRVLSQGRESILAHAQTITVLL